MESKEERLEALKAEIAALEKEAVSTMLEATVAAQNAITAAIKNAEEISLKSRVSVEFTIGEHTATYSYGSWDIEATRGWDSSWESSSSDC